MPLTLEFENWYLPIKLEKTAIEKPDIKHRFYGCVECQTETIRQSFCPKCNKETTAILIGEKEEVGSRDLWDLSKVSLKEIFNELGRITNVKDIIQSSFGKKKPKASEVAKWKEQQSKVGKSLTLSDLYKELKQTGKALQGKIVFNSKINECLIYPNVMRRTLQMLVLDGNTETIKPTEPIETEDTKKEKPIAVEN